MILFQVMDSYNEVEKALSGNLDDLDTNELEQELNDLLSNTGNTGGTPGKEKVGKGICKYCYKHTLFFLIFRLLFF